MNIAYHGHATTLVYTYTRDGIFSEHTEIMGIPLIYASLNAAMDAAHGGHLLFGMENLEDYRREYYSLTHHGNGADYYTPSRYLGYREGEIANSLINIPPKDPAAPIDFMIVWDEGFGGLDLPADCANVFWASDKILPNPEQFAKNADKTFLFLDADVLRGAGAMISRRISWERTAADLIREIQINPQISYLLDAAVVFVSFSLDGAVLISKIDGELQASLMLTHGGGEGNVRAREDSAAIGVFAMMTGLIVQQIPLQYANLEKSGADMRGGLPFFSIMADRFAAASSDNSQATVIMGNLLRRVFDAGEHLSRRRLVFDNDGLMLTNDWGGFRERNWQSFPIPIKSFGGIFAAPDDWAVTENVNNRQIYDVAHDYVLRGADVIDGLPQLAMGGLITVDRAEIESYQNICNLILSYNAGESMRPLSIAVFGSPGSGKSFGVTQIAKSILPGKVERLEFNVSQFISQTDLGAAFQKVRDVILEGKLPLVFFDEFDSDKDAAALGWIKSFLMPMQDGRFRDESGEHPLGRCILVFAGGTAPNYEEFAAPMQTAEFRNIKGPDFISRLKGTINVLGPNPKSHTDKNYILRRALLLRNLCERRLNMAAERPISENIIRAMLMVPEYKHGARSMEAIIDMSRLDGGILDPAGLPFYSQLALHVDARAFLDLVLNGMEGGNL
ncbi:MAG: ATP-binding protein [Defluviitaleaceae bacterium]|nr:ATP-binding protein [Defluviitaleaceae bacterium]